jgi:hypothetical protein
MRYQRAAALVVTIGGLIAAVGYGVAQNNVVTQAEWAVYVVRALELDWSLPPNAKSYHYIDRLNWGSSIDFSALHLQEGSSPFLRAVTDVDPNFVQAESPAAEALYRVNTHRPGDYGFRVRLAGGGGVVKIKNTVFEVFQPDQDFRWVDLSKITLNPGEHSLSLLLSEGTRAQSIGVTPPCLTPVEPIGGWDPLAALTYGDLAVTVAKALDLEYNLPEIGPEITLKGEDFTPTLRVPLEGEGENVPEEPPEPFWLSSGDAILSAEITFDVAERGFFTLEARYISPNSVRWVINGCLRAITCPEMSVRGQRGTRIIALELDAGTHTLEVTLPPNASLDKVIVQQRDPDIEEYLGIVADEGIGVGDAQAGVPRRSAISAAIRVRSMFHRWADSLCDDSLSALEEAAALLAASNQGGSGSAASGAGISVQPIFPTDVNRTRFVASSVVPE